ncbi:MAG: site-specific DNA-methyltransferase [Gammaproteobacteria bacterium]|nr:site-specific DNA-methyltransferase [Gammaproteobacteria bacterium]MYF38718.1 site-specific DNA-methyltransferase [Gammaproteobacteria bacterium]
MSINAPMEPGQIKRSKETKHRSQNVNTNRFVFSSSRTPKLTHYAFRYPAKFHLPVLRDLIRRYSRIGDTCLDPFNGAGTLVVEAVANDRNAIGLDVDPLAVFVSRVKSTRLSPSVIDKHTHELLQKIQKRFSDDKLLQKNILNDIDERAYVRRLKAEDLEPPPIPKLDHWFRKSVIVQLARIKSLVDSMDVDEDVRNFFLLCFASIIRKCSNADPVPVSGLEVTSYMRQKEAEGRAIDVERIMIQTIQNCLVGAKEYFESTNPDTTVVNEIFDARNLADSEFYAEVVITSPPYQNAVDYYRRHQLEMFWLGLVSSTFERQQLIPNYLGRTGVAKKYLPLSSTEVGTVGSSWMQQIEETSHRRAMDFFHYYCGMHDFFTGVATLLKTGSLLVMVVGNNTIFGREYDTVELLRELSVEHFEVGETFWYPVRNRYMSYERRNGANIDQEYILVMRKR